MKTRSPRKRYWTRYHCGDEPICGYAWGSTAIQGSSRSPLGTLGVNILGSFTLSFITYSAEKSMALPESSRLFFAVGMLGAFTTMSTFSLETFRLVEEKQNLLFLANLMLNNILCLAGIYLGKVASTLL